MKKEKAFIIRRIPLAQFHRGCLRLGLTCPVCGRTQHIDCNAPGLKIRAGICPKCGTESRLRPQDLRAVLERGFRRAAKRVEKANRQELTDVLAVIISNAVRLLTPILKTVIVRFRGERIGHQVFNTCVFLWTLEEKDWGEALLFGEPYDFKTEANHYLGKKWGDRFIITPAAGQAYEILRNEPKERHDKTLPRQTGSRKIGHIADLRAEQWTDAFDLNPASHIFPIVFTLEEEERARTKLAEMGIRPGRPYVCFLGRDSRYMNEALPGRDWSHHDCRDMDINTYLPAMHWLADRDVTCLRMGSMVQEPLAVSRPGIVDYAVSGRDEFMDIYLFMNCFFTVTCGTGPDILPLLLGRQTLICNYTLFYIPQPQHRMDSVRVAYKKFQSRGSGKLLSFQEILSRGLESIFCSNEFGDQKIDLINNTPEEILECVKETYAKAAGKWTISAEESRMQDQYRRLLSGAHPEYAPQLGALPSGAYLRMNPHLLA